VSLIISPVMFSHLQFLCAICHILGCLPPCSDPLDGTTNFVHRFPFVCVSIALAVRRSVVVGVVYNPVLDELFTATQVRGEDDKRLSP
jgi:hypothetical protein